MSLTPLEQRLMAMHASSTDTFPPRTLSPSRGLSRARKSALPGALAAAAAAAQASAAAAAASAAMGASSPADALSRALASAGPLSPDAPSVGSPLGPSAQPLAASLSSMDRPESVVSAPVGSIGSAAAASLALDYHGVIGLEDLDNISFASESDNEELSTSVPYRTISSAAAAAGRSTQSGSSGAFGAPSQSPLVHMRANVRGSTLLAISAAIEELEKSTSPAAAAVAEKASTAGAGAAHHATPKPKTLWRSMKKNISHTLFGTKEERAAKSAAAAAEAAAPLAPMKSTIFGRALWNLK